MRRVHLLTFFSLVLLTSCSKDKLPEVKECEEEITYENQIEPLIAKSCAYAGCHVTGFASGDFSTYESMTSFLDDGKFETRVLGSMDMPPSYAPEGKPKSLTAEEVKLIECWKANDYAQ